MNEYYRAEMKSNNGMMVYNISDGQHMTVLYSLEHSQEINIPEINR